MKDCIWSNMLVCAGSKCKCEQHISINSDKGKEMEEQWKVRVRDAITNVSIEFATENGFK